MTETDKTLRTIAYVFAIISTVCSAFLLIPLAWTIPMTVHIARTRKNEEPVGIGFKVCCILFLGLISGILLCCESKSK